MYTLTNLNGRPAFKLQYKVVTVDVWKETESQHSIVSYFGDGEIKVGDGSSPEKKLQRVDLGSIKY